MLFQNLQSYGQDYYTRNNNNMIIVYMKHRWGKRGWLEKQPWQGLYSLMKFCTYLEFLISGPPHFALWAQKRSNSQSLDRHPPSCTFYFLFITTFLHICNIFWLIKTNFVGKLDIYMQRIEIALLPYTVNKTWLKMDLRLKCKI